jgi:small subunit ribosomal protein S3Ae
MATDTKIKKKIFAKIIAPKIFQELVIGESPVTDARLLLGRKMKLNLMGISGDPKDQNAQIKLEINSLKGADSVGAEILGYTLLPAFVRRLVRKEKCRVDDCFNVVTSDGKNVIIKPFLLTINIVPNSVLTSLRKKAAELIRAEALKFTYENFLLEIMNHKLQEKVRKDLNKVYPLKQCEIRDFQLVVEKKKKEEVVENAQTIN